jgi:hypothetical protein
MTHVSRGGLRGGRLFALSGGAIVIVLYLDNGFHINSPIMEDEGTDIETVGGEVIFHRGSLGSLGVHLRYDGKRMLPILYYLFLYLGKKSNVVRTVTLNDLARGCNGRSNGRRVFIFGTFVVVHELDKGISVFRRKQRVVLVESGFQGLVVVAHQINQEDKPNECLDGWTEQIH